MASAIELILRVFVAKFGNEIDVDDTIKQYITGTKQKCEETMD